MTKTTKIVIGIIVAIIVIGGIWWTTNKKPIEKDVIKIGVTLPLSGNLAKNGGEIKGGLEIASEEINSKGGINGKQLQLIIEDNAGDPSKAVSTANKLLTVDGANIMFSGFTHLTGAIAPIVDKNKKLLLYQSTVPSFAEESTYVFKDYFDVGRDGELLAKAAIKNKDKKIGIIYLESDFSKDFIKSFEKVLNENDGEIVTKQAFTSQDRDYRIQLTKIKKSDVDGLLVLGYPFQEMLIFKQIKELGINLKIYGWCSLFPEILEDEVSLGVLKENNAIVTDYASDRIMDSTEIRNFEDKYFAKYNKKPSYNSYYAYDDILILADALKECKNSTDIVCLKRKLLQTTFEGLTEDIRFDGNGVSIRPIYIRQYKEGKLVDFEM